MTVQTKSQYVFRVINIRFKIENNIITCFVLSVYFLQYFNNVKLYLHWFCLIFRYFSANLLMLSDDMLEAMELRLSLLMLVTSLPFISASFSLTVMWKTYCLAIIGRMCNGNQVRTSSYFSLYTSLDWCLDLPSR